MKDRIKQFMDYKSISAGELASLVDVQRSNISHILNGRNKPGASFIEKLLLSFSDLNARWLFTGEGNMIEDNKSTVGVFNSELERKDIIQENTSDVLTEMPKAQDKYSETMNEPIERVVLLFKDGTFADFNKK